MAQSLAVARACADNITILCKGVQPDKGRMGTCVRAHIGELSASCQAVVMKAAVVGKACRADVKRNCGGVRPGRGRIEGCMKEHLADISFACKGALARAAVGMK